MNPLTFNSSGIFFITAKIKAKSNQICVVRKMKNLEMVIKSLNWYPEKQMNDQRLFRVIFKHCAYGRVQYREESLERYELMPKNLQFFELQTQMNCNLKLLRKTPFL